MRFFLLAAALPLLASAALYTTTPAIQAFLPAAYEQSRALSPDCTVFWSILANDTIRLAVKVKTIGWAAFGIAEPGSGGMEGADIVSFVVSNVVRDDGSRVFNTTFEDRYSLSKSGAAPRDSKCEDITPLAGYILLDGYIAAEWLRTLSASDPQDRAILPGKQNVIWAWGDGDTLGYHGPTKRGASAIVFIEDETTRSALAPSSQTYFNISLSIPIPTNQTAYWCSSFLLPESLPNQVTHITDVELIVPTDPTVVSVIHHVLIYACNSSDPYFKRYIGTAGDCYVQGAPEYNCNQIVYGWTPGAPALKLPTEAGFRVNDPSDPLSIMNFMVEVHYNNPTQLSGLIDTSVVRLGYTTQLRPLDAGSLVLGDALVLSRQKIAPSVESMFSFLCPNECTQTWPAPINVFGHFLHMHMTGIRAWVETTKGASSNAVTSVLSPKVDFFKFDFQSTYPTNFTISPGDSLLTRCVYKPTGNTSLVFGPQSSDEMCQSYMFYYPRIKIPAATTPFRMCSYHPRGAICGNFPKVVPAAHPNGGNATFDGIPPRSFGISLAQDSTCRVKPILAPSFPDIPIGAPPVPGSSTLPSTSPKVGAGEQGTGSGVAAVAVPRAEVVAAGLVLLAMALFH